MRLENKIALITGGATGIGRAIALRFAQEGAQVLIADINEPGGQQTADEAGGRFIRCDVSSSWDCENAAGAAKDWFGGLQILVNSAAFLGGYRDIGTMDPTDWREGLSVSLDGLFYASHYAVPLIEASGGGADIGPIMATGVPGMGLNVDGTRYFWFHHTDADTPDKLDKAEVQRCVAVMAVMAYIAADIEQSLPR